MPKTPARTKTGQKSTPKPVNQNNAEFSRLFFEQIPADDRALLSAAEQKALIDRHVRLSHRREGEVTIAFTAINEPGKGWEGRRTALDIVTDDMAFLIDSVTALLAEKRYLVDLLLHPRLPVLCGDGSCDFDTAARARSSHLHIVVRGALSAPQQKELRHDIEGVVRDVRFATRDWQAMRLKAIETKQHLQAAPLFGHDADDVGEYSEFLDYLYDNNFTFLGCRSYRFARGANGKLKSEIIKGSGLGLLSDDLFPAYISDNGAALLPEFQELRLKMPPLYISKVNRLSTVHRRVPLDAVAVHHYDDKGNITGETLFIGLFTSVTYSRSLRSIPFLKHKADAVIQKSGFEPASHDGRALRHILEKYPRDELFQINVSDLHKTCLSILRLQERQRIALYCRPDLFRRYVSCLVYVPRDRYETRLRLKFQHILEQELSGTCTNFTSSVDDSPLVRILFTITVKQNAAKKFDAGAIEKKLQEAGRVWGDALADALHRDIHDDAQAETLAHRYAEAFSNDYRERYGFADAISDIGKVEACLSSGALQIDLQEGKDAHALKLYTRDQALVLSDILPVLENLGVRVLTEHPFAVRPGQSRQTVMIQDFALSSKSDVPFKTLKPLFEEAFTGVFAGVYENDALNGLTVNAGLAARDVMIVRTYVRYLRQAGLPFSLPYIEQAVVAHADLARLFTQYFHEKFDPKLKTRKVDAIATKIEAGLEAVKSLDHDRILRAILTALKASLRTNFYQTLPDGSPKPYLSVKLDSRRIDYLPNPKPYREIFVYSPRMEGIHLRNARIARGGIRWSDRNEDFRAEVLGLMKAQTVKNAVIVPSGAKGGFIVKNPPVNGDRAAVQAEGIACYQYLVRGLLDITDNYAPSGKVVKPARVVCIDGDDPYLVVAADKGTATFSDIANKLSIEYGFWMNDAFASGGSAGYDHKAMGITARGAWESVKRHFREINHDTQAAPFDVVGVGDMAGDVFGNGMLLSPHIRLIGAFNHVHIFCDPDPDAKSSFAERQRLFKNVLGWDHYNLKLLSKGGRLYARKDKTLELTPEIQKRFDLPKPKVTPSELMSAMLKARTDLIYLGGIGTYVKASSETQADASDRSNDAHRINASELRTRVVGEGANLGFTQRARIECAERGVRLNADFIDNSAGVDTSDHEVNIKILLSKVMAKSSSKMTRGERDKLLKSMTDEVAALVLNDNYQQTQAISLVEMQAADLLPVHQKFMQDLEREGVLDRALEFLPDDETIARRQAIGKGLTRPEIGITISYAKMRLREELLSSDIPDKADLNDWLIGYFPRALQTKFESEILAHPLRREIVSTVVANALVNRLGPTFVNRIAQSQNVDAAAVVRAFVAACTILELPKRWAEMENLDNKVPANMQMKAFRELAILLERQIVWFLKVGGRKVQIDKLVKDWSKPVHAYMALVTSEKSLKSFLAPAQYTSWQQRYRGWTDAAIPPAMAVILAGRTKLVQVPAVLTLAAETKKSIADVAAVYLPLGERFAFSWLRTQIDHLPKNDRWAREAATSMEERIDQVQMMVTRSVLAQGKKGKSAAEALSAWLAAREAQTMEIFAFITDLKRTGLSDLTVLMVLLQKIEKLI